MQRITRGVLAAAIALTTLTSGCGDELYGAFNSGNPTFAQVAGNMPITSGKGRIYMHSPDVEVTAQFYPDLILTSGLGGAAIGSALLGGISFTHVVVDRRYYSDIADGSFAYIDLPSGGHELLFSGLAGDHKLNLNLSAGEAKFVQYIGTSPENGILRLVTPSTAKEALSTSRHVWPDGRAMERPMCKKNRQPVNCPPPKRIMERFD